MDFTRLDREVDIPVGHHSREPLHDLSHLKRRQLLLLEKKTADPSASLGMTKRRGLLQVEGGRQRKGQLLKGLPDPPPPCPLATVPSLQQPSPFCHPERSRGICSAADPSW